MYNVVCARCHHSREHEHGRYKAAIKRDDKTASFLPPFRGMDERPNARMTGQKRRGRREGREEEGLSRFY